MKFEIQKNPVGILEAQMQKDEQITAEAGAFVFSKGNIEIKTRIRKGGFLKSLKVAALGSESFFVNDYIAKQDGCVIGFTGPPVGDIIKIPITPDDGAIIQSGAFVCSTSSVDLDTKWQGFTKGIFGSELFMLKATGSGELFANAYGGIIQTQLESGQTMTLDNYHLVALSLNAEYKVKKLGGLKTTILGGEGLVTEITGPGMVYSQTKNLKELINLLGITKSSGETTNQFSVGGFRFG